MNSASAGSSKAVTIVLWVLCILLAAFFLSFATMKLIGHPFMVAEFNTVGLGQWFRYFTGSLEVVGALLILVPRLSAIGAIILLIVDVGAFIAVVTILHADWIHCVVVAALLITVIYLQRRRDRASLLPADAVAR